MIEIFLKFSSEKYTYCITISIQLATLYSTVKCTVIYCTVILHLIHRGASIKGQRHFAEIHLSRGVLVPLTAKTKGSMYCVIFAGFNVGMFNEF